MSSGTFLSEQDAASLRIYDSYSKWMKGINMNSKVEIVEDGEVVQRYIIAN